MTQKSTDVVWQDREITRRCREQVLGQRGCVVWFTGLSGSGKSTIAARLEHRLNRSGRAVYYLDGDNLRHGLCSDLHFAPADRRENIRRVGEVALLFAEAGVITLAAFISPYREDRERIRERAGKGRFFEVHVSTPVSVCEARDVKGLYARARAGEIPNFTGISAPYEAPENAELTLDTTDLSLDECVDRVANFLLERIRPEPVP